ncbi:diaminopimelate epimerase [Paracoccaceae bacterium GXU_MW_L88]
MGNPSAAPVTFRKMHGLGNDFVILDLRAGGALPGADLVARMGDRHRGIGFDQLAAIEDDAEATARITFFNSDGSRAGACGNASRCLAMILLNESGAETGALKTDRGLLPIARSGENFTVNMGLPQQAWDEIPLARDVDPMALPLDGSPSAVGMGNPHCVFVVEDAEAADLPTLGPRFEHDPLFPERTNVEFISLIGPDHLRMRVWERGGMITQACGSGACAAAVIAAERGLTGRTVRITLDGGDLEIDWRTDGVWMTGPATHVFDGVWS